MGNRPGTAWKAAFALLSIFIHLALVYCVYYARFVIDLEPGKEEVKIVPIPRAKLFLPDTPEPPMAKEKIRRNGFQEPQEPGTRKVVKIVRKTEPETKPPIPDKNKNGNKKEKDGDNGAKKTQVIERASATAGVGEPSTGGETTEPLIAPAPNFDGRAYLREEKLEEIFREHDRKKYGRKKRGGASSGDSGVRDFQAESGGSDIVVDSEGRAYFQGKGYDVSHWARAVVARINGNWNIIWEITLTARAAVGISVTIARDGRLLKAEIKRSSAFQPLDQSALNAVNLSAPFPRLPDEYPGESLSVFFLFNYNENDNGRASTREVF